MKKEYKKERIGRKAKEEIMGREHDKINANKVVFEVVTEETKNVRN
jgi:hypothetical protein